MLPNRFASPPDLPMMTFCDPRPVGLPGGEEPGGAPVPVARSTCVPAAATWSFSALVRSTVLRTFGVWVNPPGAIAGYGNGVWSGPRISGSPACQPDFRLSMRSGPGYTGRNAVGAD